MSFQYFWWWYEIEILTFKKKERLGLKGRGLTGDLGCTIYGIETFTLGTKMWTHWYDHFERTTLEWLHWNDHIEMMTLKWLYWNDFIGMTTLKWLHWNDHIEMTTLKWPHWNDHIEMTTVAAAFTQCSSIFPLQQHFLYCRIILLLLYFVTCSSSSSIFSCSSIFSNAFFLSRGCSFPLAAAFFSRSCIFSRCSISFTIKSPIKPLPLSPNLSFFYGIDMIEWFLKGNYITHYSDSLSRLKGDRYKAL